MVANCHNWKVDILTNKQKIGSTNDSNDIYSEFFMIVLMTIAMGGFKPSVACLRHFLHC